jgi:hypothetical protein
LSHVDHAYELYQNATREGVKFLRYVNQRAAEDESFRDSWRTLIVESNRAADSFRALTSVVSDASAHIVDDASSKLQKVDYINFS